MKISEIIIQGVVQGLTEFLPVSSSGHLTIAQHFMGIKEDNLFFDVVLHVGTLVSVFIVYHKILFKLFISMFTLPYKILSGKSKSKDEKMLINFFVSLLPLFLLFIPIPNHRNLKSLATSFSESGNLLLVGFFLIITSILLFLGILYNKNTSKKNHTSISQVSTKSSFIIGLSQLCAAIFPGLSRSGSTMSVGLMRGMKRQDAVDFSFIMGTPTILAAAALELKEVLNLGVEIDKFSILLGILVSSFVGCMSIKLFKWLTSNDKTWIFSIYTLCVGCFLIIFCR